MRSVSPCIRPIPMHMLSPPPSQASALRRRRGLLSGGALHTATRCRLRWAGMAGARPDQPYLTHPTLPIPAAASEPATPARWSGTWSVGRQTRLGGEGLAVSVDHSRPPHARDSACSAARARDLAPTSAIDPVPQHPAPCLQHIRRWSGAWRWGATGLDSSSRWCSASPRPSPRERGWRGETGTAAPNRTQKKHARGRLHTSG